MATGCRHPQVSTAPVPPNAYMPYIYTLLPPAEVERQKAAMRRARGITDAMPPTPYINRAQVMMYVPSQVATVPLPPAMPLPGGHPTTYLRDHVAAMQRAWLDRAGGSAKVGP